MHTADLVYHVWHRCYKPEERKFLLSVIEAGFGSFSSFNAQVRRALTRRVEEEANADAARTATSRRKNKRSIGDRFPNAFQRSPARRMRSPVPRFIARSAARRSSLAGGSGTPGADVGGASRSPGLAETMQATRAALEMQMPRGAGKLAATGAPRTTVRV